MACWDFHHSTTHEVAIPTKRLVVIANSLDLLKRLLSLRFIARFNDSVRDLSADRWNLRANPLYQRADALHESLRALDQGVVLSALSPVAPRLGREIVELDSLL